MKSRMVLSVIASCVILWPLFLISLNGCGWSSTELFAGGLFLFLIVVLTVLANLQTNKALALLVILLLPMVGAWLYSILVLFSPGDFSVGPCVEKSSWKAFPALYGAASLGVLANPKAKGSFGLIGTASLVLLVAMFVLVKEVF